MEILDNSEANTAPIGFINPSMSIGRWAPLLRPFLPTLIWHSIVNNLMVNITIILIIIMVIIIFVVIVIIMMIILPCNVQPVLHAVDGLIKVR